MDRTKLDADVDGECEPPGSSPSPRVAPVMYNQVSEHPIPCLGFRSVRSNHEIRLPCPQAVPSAHARNRSILSTQPTLQMPVVPINDSVLALDCFHKSRDKQEIWRVRNRRTRMTHSTIISKDGVTGPCLASIGAPPAFSGRRSEQCGACELHPPGPIRAPPSIAAAWR